MMEIINPNLCTWIEAAISLHLQKKIPLDRVRELLVGRMFSALMIYWRYDVPNKWRFPTVEAVCTWVGFRLRDWTLWDANVDDFDSLADAIYIALENNDWQSFSELPDKAWKWAHILSGLKKQDWENLINLTSVELNAWVRCPACAWDGKLGDLGEVTDVQNPFSDAGSTSLHICCSHCGSIFKFNVATTKIEHPVKGLDYLRWVIVALCLTCVLLPIAAILFYILK